MPPWTSPRHDAKTDRGPPTGFFGTATTQYASDYGTDALLTLANNLVTLTTVGALGLNINDVAPFGGFDIFTTPAGANTAYALLDVTPGFTQVYSLAVTPTASPIPEPGTLALSVAGLLAPAGMALRRRRRA